jgi:hypothetical protein
MKTQFSIISYFDPYGDMKSNRKVHSRKNFESLKSLEDVKKIVERYSNGRYYNGVEVAKFDNRVKEILNFDESYYNHSQLPKG